MSEEIVKDRTLVRLKKEENLLNDTSLHSQTFEEPKPEQYTISEELFKDRTLTRPNKEETPLIGIDKHSETPEEPKPEQGIMLEELAIDRAPLVLSNEEENHLIDTDIHSETLDETKPEQGIMSEELVKERKQDGIFEKPMCLIASEGGRLKVVEKTVRELEKIELPLNVVAIAGLYRTGKSYLMNRLAGQNSGFVMGSSVESTTKGIWAWCRQHPSKQSEILLLLDTEGLGDATKGNIDHDNKILTITTLLSSTLVYNVMSAFNQDAIEKLTYVTMLSKNLKVSSNNPSDDDIESIMPQFVLCVRDFNLELVHDGEVITEDEYLEICLKTRDAQTEEDEKYNRPREYIKKYFKRRKVFTFDRPASRKVMSCLDQAREEDLNQDFIHETKEFLEYIYTCPGKFLSNKSPLTGRMLATLLREYEAAINAGNVPCVENAVMIMSRQENMKNTTKAVEEYQSLLKRIQLPVYDKHQLCKSNLKFKEETLSSLQSNLLFDTDNEILKATEGEMQVLYEKLVKRNSDLLYDKFTRKLDEIHDKDVKANIRRGKYAIHGGHAIYEKDMRLLYDKFAEEFKNIDIAEKMRAQDDFESRMLPENKQILQDDKILSEKVTEDLMIEKLDEMKIDMIKSQQFEIGKLEAKLDGQRSYYEEKMEKLREKEREREQRRNDEIREISFAHERDREMIARYEAWEYQRWMQGLPKSKEQEKWCQIS